MRNGIFTILISFTALSLAACGSGDDDAPAQGTEGGSCYPNGTCNDGLECRSDLCVEDGSGGDDTEDVLADCLACGEETCAAEYGDCEAAGGCGDAIDCWIGCGADAGCIAACDVTSLAAEDMLAANALFACIGANCVSECTPDIPDPDDTDTHNDDTDTNQPIDTDDLEACEVGDDYRGSCVSGTLENCVDGFWLPGNCSGCDIVVPNNTCVRMAAFALEEQGDGEISELVGIEPTQQTFAQSSVEVAADWYLDAYQLGVIQVVFNTPIDPARVEIDYSPEISFVTLETDDGLGGCQYEIDGSSGRLMRYWKMGYDGEGYPIVEWYGCWGTLSTYTTNEPTTLTIMNIRTPMTIINETVALSLYEILL